ncbi:TonB-dependent receptor [Aquimarina gracilis]
MAQTISGTIRENIDNLPLPGAEVVIKGTSIGSSTDFDGKFNLVYDNPSSAVLVITYLGFETREVNVSDYSDPNNITIMLEESTFGLDEVVISANLEGQRRALNIQRAADNIKNVISTDLISRFPDLNVSDALQRVPGVNIDLDQGEGDAISIRGTPQNYTTVTINGEQLQNTGTSNNRTSGLYQFPVDQLSQIEVTKTITPDMDGDAIGGSVNLSSPKARRTKLGVKAELGGGYVDLTEGVNFIGKFKLDQRFAVNDKNPNGAFGLMGNVSFYRREGGEDRIEGRWRTRDFDDGNGEQFYLSDLNLRPLASDRSRIGVTLTSDYQFDNDNFIVVKGFYSFLREDELRQRTQFRPRNGEREAPDLSTEARARKRFRDRVVDRYTISLNADAQFKVGNLEIVPGYAFSTGQRDENGTRGEIRADGTDVDMQISLADPDFPQIFPVGGQPGDQFDDDLFDDYRNIQFYNRIVKNAASTAKINFELPITLDNSLLTLKTGYKNRVTRLNRSGATNVFEYEGDQDITIAQFNTPGLVRTGLLDGNYNYGASVDPGLFSDFYFANIGDFELNEEQGRQETSNFLYAANENTDAVYFMGKLRTGKFNILAGVRYESVNLDYDANIVRDEDPNADGGLTVTPVSDRSSYDFVLPNLQVKYELDDFTNLRLAYTKGYSRPNFDDVIPSLQIFDENDEIEVGNANFQPPSANNFDLLFERYLGTVGILSGGVFYKDIKDFRFVRVFQIQTGDEFPGADIFTQEERDRFLVFQPDNGDGATVLGAEVNIQSNFKFLPGFLSNFGIYLNYTYTDSDATIDGVDGRRLPGQSPHTANAALTFDKGGLSARFTANYQDERIEQIGGDRLSPGDSDVIRAERLQLDANASYTIKKKWRIYAEIQNINDAPQIEYLGNESRVWDISYYGFRSSFGVSYTF